MKILPVFQKLEKTLSQTSNNKIFSNHKTVLSDKINIAYPSNYYLNFQARVDKDLISFVQRNQDNLPYSVKTYIENLSDEEKRTITPLQAQRNAFDFLTICETVEDVKDAYPEEPLFAELKSANNAKAKIGLLYDIRLMRKDLLGADEQILKTGEKDLTIYLLKKIFLEGKTIKEINEQLDADLNEIFKKEDKRYIGTSTLSALGIQLPSVPYLNSLKYTREGYSDAFASKISQRWSELSQEEKDKIRASHSARALTQEQKDRIAISSSLRWSKMPEEEKVALINRMQVGSQRQKISMIDAWNNLPDVRMDLAKFLTENNFYAPQSIIYRDNSYTSAMEIVMQEFWKKFPEHAKRLGLEIEKSFQRYDDMEAKKQLSEFEKSVLDKRTQAKNEIKQLIKTSKTNNVKSVDTLIDDYKTMFSFLPDTILKEQTQLMKSMSADQIELWIKHCTGQKVDKNLMEKVAKIEEILAPRMSIQMQVLIATYVSVVEEALAPIFNPVTGKEFKPIFPANLDFRFPDITRLYFDIKKNGYNKTNLLEKGVLRANGSGDVLMNFRTEHFTDCICKSNRINSFNTSLMRDYKYTFESPINIDKTKYLYEKIVNSKTSRNVRNDVCKKLIPQRASTDLQTTFYELVASRLDIVYILNSPEISEGMKLRVLKPFNDAAIRDNGLYSPLYVEHFEKYKQRFVDFFSVK